MEAASIANPALVSSHTGLTFGQSVSKWWVPGCKHTHHLALNTVLIPTQCVVFHTPEPDIQSTGGESLWGFRKPTFIL